MPPVRRTSRTRYPVLTAEALNRATLARQLLLEPARGLDVVDAVERLGALQAQEPASPFVALWTRLADFDAATLRSAFAHHRVVKGTLMRVTVHAVSMRDYRHFLPAVLPMLRTVRRWRIDGLERPPIEPAAEALLRFAAEPRTGVELRDEAGRLTAAPGEEAWWRIRRNVPFLHVPSDASWSFGPRPRLIDARRVLDGRPFAAEDEGTVQLARRYLAAFGPASVPDMASWSGLTVTRLRSAVATLDAAGALTRLQDDAGRELLDLHDAPRPDPAIPAPPRFLPMWDSLLLAHADRTRVLPAECRPIVIAKNGDVLPTFLVDGRVAGLWWPERDGGGPPRIVLEPFGRLTSEDLRALESEGERLAAFLEPNEPGAFGRYRRSRARRSVAG
jgi:hypothetical protein